MPLNPIGLGKDFVDRLRERVRTELGGGGVQQVGLPEDSGGLQSRIRQYVREKMNLSEPTPETPNAAPRRRGPPQGLSEVQQRIQEAARHTPPVLLYGLYNGNWRYIEPYSYRFLDRDRPWIPLLYGYCHKDDSTEAYKLYKFQDLQVTDRPFSPRWPVEL